MSCTGKQPGHAATIGVLSDNVLLEIFDFCQKDHDPSSRKLAGRQEAVWDWQILVHVCQMWRRVVFASPLRLNLRILCKHGTRVRKNLDIWPAFPIHIEYFYSRTIEGIDEDSVIAALEHPDHVRAVSHYQVTSLLLRKMITIMQEPFPALTHLFLSTHDSTDVPVLPSEFLGRSAPCLQTIKLVRIPFPALPALLLSTSDLVTLHLDEIPQNGYISPEAMVMALTALTRLEDLRLGFRSPASRPDQVRLPPTTRIVLPALTDFNFRGAREYLEDFVASIYTPRLHMIWTSFFNQIVDFEIPRLWQFVEHSEDFHRPMQCLLEFQAKNVTFCASPTTRILESKSFAAFTRCMNINILCKGIDWQVSHISQALNRISAVISNMLHLAIDSSSVSPEPEGMDDIEWLELLRPFSSIQTLFVSREFAGHVSRALENATSVMATTFLPALDMLCLEGQPVPPLHRFIASRRESANPVITVNTRMAFEKRLRSYVS